MKFFKSFLALLSLTSGANASLQTPHRVEIKHSSTGFTLLRDGNPYLIKGVGGDADRKLLVSLGGNSFRTWGAENLGEVLDKAQAKGLTVTAGIWLGHREYFDYHDKAKVAAQLEMCREIVQKYKNHPALLMWAFGNEAEGDGNDVEVYKAIEEIAAMSHREDKNHPAMTVIAELGGDKVANIGKYCPDVDIVGVNSYGGGPSVPKRYASQGIDKPYILTEFGPPGPWESGKTKWGAPLELSSTEKAERYAASYIANVRENSNFCLGSYSFLWGSKVEGTPTWFGMVLKDNSLLESVDVIQSLWNAKAPLGIAPKIHSLKLTGDASGAPGSVVTATLDAHLADTIEWSLIRELGSTSEDPAHASSVTELANSIHSPTGSSVRVTLPGSPGAYRIMAVARSKGWAATANIPIRVVAPVDSSIPKAKLPYVVYQDHDRLGDFVPTGWMGDTGSLSLEMNCEDHPHSGKSCIEVTFSSPRNWAGIAWQYPANDWGNEAESINLNGAKKLSFWMRGAAGGEKVKVNFGILGAGKPHPDSGSGELSIELTQDWKYYEVDLEGKDMTKIKTGFVVTLAGSGKPQTFYIDDVQYQ